MADELGPECRKLRTGVAIGGSVLRDWTSKHFNLSLPSSSRETPTDENTCAHINQGVATVVDKALKSPTVGRLVDRFMSH